MSSAPNPLVSVVMATYNMAQYLPLAVRSVLQQTYPNLELLIVDDGSTDDTRAVVQPFLADPRVRYLHQPNGGQTIAKNHGVREARGQFIGFLDADDLWVVDKLELQLPLFARHEVGVVYSRLVYIDEAGIEKRVSDNELFRGQVSGPLFVQNFIGFGTALVRKECFDRLGSFDETLRMGIDYDLWLRFSTQYEFDYLPRPLLHYRIWAGQMSKNCKTRYRTGIATMQRFLDANPGLVDERTRRDAWAHTYVGYGACLFYADRHRMPALREFFTALRYRPGYLPAWRAIVMTLLGVT
jgi:glycosyltransferase involved in cell wall biosynthesis